MRLLRHIIHLRPRAWIAHRKVVLGSMTGTVGALASWLATAFVTLDQRAAQDRLERGQLAQESLTASSQGGGSLVFLHCYQTTYITGLIVLEGNTFFGSPQELVKIFKYR